MNMKQTGLNFLTITPSVSHDLQSVVLSSALEALRKAAIACQADSLVKAFPLSHQTVANLAFSSVVLLMKHSATSDAMAARVVLLSNSNAPLTPTTLRTDAGTINIPRMPSLALDDNLKTAVIRLLASQGVDTDNVIYTGGETVGAELQWSDPKATQGVLVTAMRAMMDVLNTQAGGGISIDLTKMQKDKQEIQFEVRASREEAVDYAGKPVHRTLVTTLTVVSTAQQANASSVNTAASAPVANAGAYIDYLYAPAQPAPMQMGYGMTPVMQEAPTIKFTPRIVMTQGESPLLMNIQGLLLSVYSMALAAADGRWLQAAFPMGKTTEALGDVGALNVIGNVMNEAAGSVLKIDPSTTTTTDFLKYMSQLVRRNPVLSMLVSKSGPDSYLGQTFVECARGNSDAVSKVLAAADELTGGLFSQNYGNAGENPVFVVGTDTAYSDLDSIGTWVDRNNVRRSIQEIDLCAVLSRLGTRDPNVGFQFTDTYANRQRHPMHALQIRNTLRNAVLGSTSITEVDLGYLVTFTPKFLLALVRAINNSGFPIRDASNDVLGTSANQPLVADWATAVLTMDGLAPMRGVGVNGSLNWGF